MRKKCIIHVGMHKTGSSSIQETLASNENFLNFHYADLITSNHSGKIFSVFSDSSKELHHLRRRGMTEEDIQKFISNTKNILIKNCEDIRYENMILSGEGIVKLSLNGLERLKLFLSNYFQEIYIVAYVRPPISFINSSFQQQIKEGIDYFNINNSLPYYKSKFEKFDIVFGKSNVHLWKYNPKNFKSNDVVHDFCHRLGIELNINKVYRSNETMSKEALSLLYIYRKFGKGFGIGRRVVQENNILIDAIKTLGNNKIQFSLNLIKGVLNTIEDDVKWMENRLGERLEESYVYAKDSIDSESDLLTIKLTTLNELKKLIPDEYMPCGVKGETHSEIAILVNCLRIKLTNEYLEKDKNICIKKKDKENNFVFRGKKGYLFLLRGKHEIIDFFTGKKKPNKFSINNFSYNIMERSRYCEKNNMVYKHFIFPEKMYSLQHLNNLPIKSLYKEYYMEHKEVNSHVVFFEFDEIHAEQYYNKTDTHINLYGNLKLLEEMILEPEADIKSYKNLIQKNVRLKTKFIGDLGIKLTPTQAELIVSYKPEDSISTFQNGLQKGNNGKLDILINDKAIYKKKILIFGDSFFRSMLKHLSHFYSEVIHCRSPFFHEEVIELCLPDIVYTGNTERYLSSVNLDESRYDFFMWPIIEERGLSPDIGLGNAMKKVFNLQKFNMNQIYNER